MTIDLETKKHWGPEIGREEMNNKFEPFKTQNYIHVHGYHIQYLDHLNTEVKCDYNIIQETTFLAEGLLLSRWIDIWNIINQVRFERVKNRQSSPRKSMEEKIFDDIIDQFVANLIKRLNSLINAALYWGYADDQYMPFGSYQHKLKSE